ncbi:phenylalanyl-tRNA synthetase alpha subunit [Caldicellulosiruptor bescii]|uniref:Phenylalanine--tRNA ligase alpha subunit n=3 Tax=Caldicellulosiruptor TaxID=44000 RepID=SYFA_CALBD|nr:MULTISPECIES: phenylalanine--tRNA ligase subunit alpha [Caldicellulosiruptor]B9MRS9.1 RecName: Full=Phenylalanine--tRNA ligase alpha subunit; AltName: Full=Phenylalanyl-tRNA synthetase alpha subunit; Short=PheRS [Caldicellulosiruptor bescii DSM 6725]ACM60383.1 phenylalanyl-tRNA synthetase, alpha subunit [Caldicellulosiruptor bescii DSM 6725]ADQ46274.1 phenylalanyl-tRNA synthetase, alpha subunit [Caldicellulosiruptor kronotskyensis 2002]PBC87797.1 phenylalanyl-tRNA synthetase alpha subunit [C
MNTDIANLKNQCIEELSRIKSLQELEDFQVKYLGKKGILKSKLKELSKLEPAIRAQVGKELNSLREYLEESIAIQRKRFLEEEKQKRIQSERIDVTIPGKRVEIGAIHILSQVQNEIAEIFLNMGYEIAEGPEVELDYYNFEALNIPADHPARDTQDTFYISEDVLLRTHTSPVQIRVMKSKKPPIKIISPGRVYRSDEVDSTHSPIFHQIEGLFVDKGVTMADLKGTLEVFAKRFFGEQTKVRFRPHHFPFTEPSAEVDISCIFCGGKGCRTCKGEGWIEILGAGMVHRKVLLNCGIDPDIYTGFAFGMGVERIALLRYEIEDIRLFYENDLRFLKQFR